LNRRQQGIAAFSFLTSAMVPRESAISVAKRDADLSAPLIAAVVGPESGKQGDEARLRAAAIALQIPFVEDLSGFTPAADFLNRFEISYARREFVLGFGSANNALTVALATWDGWRQLDLVARLLRRPVTPLFTTAATLTAAINAAYEDRHGQAQQLVETLDGLDSQQILSQIRTLAEREDLLDSAGRAPVIKLVNLILFEAVKNRASDIHIQPAEDRLVVRQRIDGVLFDSLDIPKALQDEVLTRVKVMGRMNIAEKRLPQDGRATVQVGNRLIDLRIASLPTSHNERIVIRLLDKSARLYTLNDLGMPPGSLERFRELIRLDHGLILVTGPTGSGKSTTLYAALQELNTKVLNALTLEDPIEYQLDDVSQTQINEKKGLTFATGLRSILRQDPDIIMVGEIRDRETAALAIQASLTGHLVFSTLHTNDAATAVTRLLDLGIEPYLVASSLVATLAQRLVRRICSHCKTPLDPSDRPAAMGESLFHGSGCANCRQTGYRGRVGIYELLVMDETCRELVQTRANAAQIRAAAMAGGMKLLRDDGLAKARAGETTLAEVLRVSRTGEDE